MRAACVTLIVLLFAGFALAQAEPSGFEQRPFPTSQAVASTDEATPPPASSTMLPELGRLVLAMAIVIGLILLMRKLFGRFVQQPGQAAGAVKLISRTVIAPRQQIVLVQIGRRIVALSDSAGTVTRVCEIADADEVASLLGRNVGSSSSFDDELTAAETRLTPAEPAPPPGARIDRPVGQSLARADQDLKSLIERVKGITREMKS
jgi:flagellar biogenesis protein FliO